ncbi:MAG: NRDE family protein [Desulfobacterales bacterium]|nr:NRDE family protein [Desulfobacterales bacterium]
MCLLLFSYRRHPRYRLLAAANRDEFYERPTAPAAFWPEQPDVLAGRDLRSGGTWMGITRTGRFAALTNYRDPALHLSDAPSRGGLVSGFLTGDCPARRYMETVAAGADRYNGFNLLAADAEGLYYFGNRGNGTARLSPGIYGLSNHLLDTPWPKVAEAKEALFAQFTGEEPFDPESVFAVLADRSRPPDHRLPDTGMGIEWERILSSRFITSETYGTRSSTVLSVEKNGTIRLLERTFTNGRKGQTRSFSFPIERLSE